MNLFLIGIAALAILAVAVAQTRKTKAVILKQIASKRVLPKTISLLIIAAQATELVRVIEHASIVNVSAALLLLAIVVASASGTESDFR